MQDVLRDCTKVLQDIPKLHFLKCLPSPFQGSVINKVTFFKLQNYGLSSAIFCGAILQLSVKKVFLKNDILHIVLCILILSNLYIQYMKVLTHP